MIGNAPGVLLHYVLEAALLTGPASLILIWLYRRSVLKGMLATAGGDLLMPVARGVAFIGASSEPVQAVWRRCLRLGIVYAAAGASAAALWTWLYFLDDIDFTAFRAFVVWYAFCWPVPATLISLFAVSWRRAVWIASAYLLAGVVAVMLWSTISVAAGRPGVSPLANAGGYLEFLAIEASIPAALVILVAAWRRIQGVSPLALAVLLVFSFSSLAATEAFVMLVDFGGLHPMLLRIGVHAWFLVATVPVGYLCWRLLRLLSARYNRKSFSDRQLLVDALWVIVSFLFCASYAARFGWKGLAGLAGFVVYRLVVQLGLTIWHPAPVPGRRLLMLRVFGFRSRTEKLFDTVAQRWRFSGGVAMIAGPDLAIRTIDPDDTLAFLSGNLDSRFVQNETDLAVRLAELDQAGDPDGRFRVTEFFCHDNTWASTLTALLGRTQVILMDLRGFRAANSGCLFELGQLAAQRRLGHTLFLVDKATDIGLLESTIGAQHLPLERVESGTAAERERVYRSLRSL